MLRMLQEAETCESAEMGSAHAVKVRSKEMAAGASVLMDAQVYSHAGYFEADIGLDTQFSGEIAFSEHKASQLKCSRLMRKVSVGLADGSDMTMGFRSVPCFVVWILAAPTFFILVGAIQGNSMYTCHDLCFCGLKLGCTMVKEW